MERKKLDTCIVRFRESVQSAREDASVLVQEGIGKFEKLVQDYDRAIAKFDTAVEGLESRLEESYLEEEAFARLLKKGQEAIKGYRKKMTSLGKKLKKRMLLESVQTLMQEAEEAKKTSSSMVNLHPEKETVKLKASSFTSFEIIAHICTK